VLLTLAGVFVVAGVFGIVWLHVMLAQNQFRLDRVNSRVATLQDHYERDRLQVDQLESPQRIVQEAEGKLGMVVPSTVIYLSPSVPPASATTGPPDSSPAEASTPAASSPGTPSATPSAMTAAGRSTPSATLGAAGATASGTPVPSRAPTDWTSVKPLLVPHP
jgi:cytoskeletal protein RodZ